MPVMKHLLQLTIILGITAAGELISKLTGIPMPGTVIGMILLLILLVTKIVKSGHIEGAGHFLLDNLALLFVPLGVRILDSFDLLKIYGLKLIILVTATTVITMGTTAAVIQLLLKIQRKSRSAEKEGA